MNSFANEPRSAVVDLHFMVINVANSFLKQKSQFNIHELHQRNDPTYDEVAYDAKLLAVVLKEVASLGVFSEDRLAENAQQAALFMERMAIAITNKDQEALDSAANDLGSMCQI